MTHGPFNPVSPVHGTMPVGWRCFVGTTGVTYRKSFKHDPTVADRSRRKYQLDWGFAVVIMENPFTGKWFFRFTTPSAQPTEEYDDPVTCAVVCELMMGAKEVATAVEPNENWAAL